MTYPRHHTMGHPADPYPVRPGTSAALTARTIDATIHPPIVRAQEAVAAFIPRVAQPLSSPPLLMMTGLTLVLFVLAIRGRFRPAGLLVSAMLMVTLTSFAPARSENNPDAPATLTAGSNGWRGESRSDPRYERPEPDQWNYSEPAEMPEISDAEMPEVPDADVPEVPDAAETAEPVEPPEPMDSPSTGEYPDHYQFVIPAEVLARLRDVDGHIQIPREILEMDKAQMRATMKELRARVREEARRVELRRRF